MQTITHTLPGYRVFENLLVITPHAELSARIQKLKTGFAEKYKTEQKPGGRPQLVLASFSQYEMLQERILHRLEHLAMGFPPFLVNLKDFGSIPDHTIYVKAASKLPIQELVKTIRSGTQRLMKMNEENKPHFIMEPHFNLARKLKPWQYEKGWLEYSQRHFSASFIVGSFAVLRRLKGETRYHLLQQFPLQNLPVHTKQGELFMD
ncbi:MAG: 2'-5' RNA ligase family protein [Chitinophagaceae bacterium]|nr:2'-5' RNA ligase family protein [Chitinophagaceae bacterium]